MSCPICGREYGGNPACECFEEIENLRATIKAMTETAAEQSRVHVDLHNTIQALNETNSQLAHQLWCLENPE